MTRRRSDDPPGCHKAGLLAAEWVEPQRLARRGQGRQVIRQNSSFIRGLRGFSRIIPFFISFIREHPRALVPFNSSTSFQSILLSKNHECTRILIGVDSCLPSCRFAGETPAVPGMRWPRIRNIGRN